jgi:hypothetical protein
VHANIDAIRVLKTIEDEAREATPEEKAILVRYSGCGAFAQKMFVDRDEAFETERNALRAVDEVKDILDKAVALATYARQAKNRQLEITAGKIRLRAERRIGDLTGEMRREGLLHEGNPVPENPNGPPDRPLKRVFLRDLGIDKHLSSRAQRLAELPEAEFEGLLAEIEARAGADVESITRGVLKMRQRAGRMAAHAARAEDGCGIENLNDLAISGKKFNAILADPPWRFETWSAKGESRSPLYRTDTLHEIMDLPVAKLD